ncbi:MAG: DMT family transporter [Pseudomonadota bacterium]
MIAAWIPVTIAAAFVQNLRFMLQKHLKATQLSTGGATFSRFVFSFPLVAALALTYGQLSDQALPGLTGTFWIYATLGGLCQILATMCVVALFARRNFAVGMTFKKTEAIQTAIVGYVLLGEGVSPGGAAALAVGFVGLILLSDPPDGGADGGWARLFNRAAGLGLASGILFAVSANAYRAASLSLESGDTFLRASLTLAAVTAFQTVALGGWLLWRERGEVRRVLRAWRVTALVGIFSMVGSLCWFIAFTLQTAAYVKAVGQIELVFSYLAGVFVFQEKNTRRELAGIATLVLSVLMIVLLR